MTSPIIGIDLGTTNCCAAWVTPQGEVRLIPSRGGENTMPSIFALTDKHIEIVGHEAKRQSQLNPSGTVKGAKRIIGLPFDHAVVRRMREYADFKVLEADLGQPEIELHGKRYTCETISSRFLRSIVDVASKHLGQEVTRAVVTVPASCNARQRQAVHARSDSMWFG